MADVVVVVFVVFFVVVIFFLDFVVITRDGGNGWKEGNALGRGRRALSTALRVRKSIAGAAAFREIQDGVPCEGNVWSGY